MNARSEIYTGAAEEKHFVGRGTLVITKGFFFGMISTLKLELQSLRNVRI